ncbi:DsbE family thiol:disulfide interchange protein [Sphingomonas sinipercae]|uniref:DsbE family thiol:disulfide interchange protein n=1 Tax=Sphingomonas sinipercae TaxID=2714944 RepID=A0A6G7ZNQ2_9SPHN|nr:DsbE family thiol:disulfide interchange protein [Sphingomonas sinipercae]QIL02552.1 DsbE family thiol:disulfide interchange protein [Sphingomonas sinipercae]
MRRWLGFVPLLVLGLIVAGLLWRLANPGDTDIRSRMVGRPVPQLALAPVAGHPAITAASLADGQPRLLNLFASWCVPCIAEAPVLMELKRQGVRIDGIAIRDTERDLGNFLERHGNPFERIGSDPESKAQVALGSAGVPESFVIDGRGVIRMQHIGPIEPSDVPKIVQALEQAR